MNKHKYGKLVIRKERERELRKKIDTTRVVTFRRSRKVNVLVIIVKLRSR